VPQFAPASEKNDLPLACPLFIDLLDFAMDLGAPPGARQEGRRFRAENSPARAQNLPRVILK
jgi:hypothetical protein